MSEYQMITGEEAAAIIRAKGELDRHTEVTSPIVFRDGEKLPGLVLVGVILHWGLKGHKLTIKGNVSVYETTVKSMKGEIPPRISLANCLFEDYALFMNSTLCKLNLESSRFMQGLKCGRLRDTDVNLSGVRVERRAAIDTSMNPVMLNMVVKCGAELYRGVEPESQDFFPMNV